MSSSRDIWDEKYLKALGLHIRALRKKSKLTQLDLGELVGLDQANIRRIELGLTNPTYRTLFTLADALNISVSELVAVESS